MKTNRKEVRKILGEKLIAKLEKLGYSVVRKADFHKKPVEKIAEVPVKKPKKSKSKTKKKK